MRALCALMAFALPWCAPARAAITVTFYSHEGGQQFPHAYFAVKGAPEAGGAAVDANYGFTAITISPAVLMGNVAGRVEHVSAPYVAASDAHFAFAVADADYWRLMALARAWYAGKESRYNLNRRNCVHFVAAAARLLGMDAPDLPGLMKKPNSYLNAITTRNMGWLEAHHAAVDTHLPPSPPREGRADTTDHGSPAGR